MIHSSLSLSITPQPTTSFFISTFSQCPCTENGGSQRLGRCIVSAIVVVTALFITLYMLELSVLFPSNEPSRGFDLEDLKDLKQGMSDTQESAFYISGQVSVANNHVEGLVEDLKKQRYQLQSQVCIR